MPFALIWWSLSFPVGTFVTGRAVGSRRRMVVQLQRRTLELDEEREVVPGKGVLPEAAHA